MKLNLLPFTCNYCGSQLAEEGELAAKTSGTTQKVFLYAYCPNKKCSKKGVEKKFKLVADAKLFEL